MAGRYDNAHSRIVALLKLVLPLAALVLLSTLFLVSRRISPEDALPYADVDVATLTREQRLTAPRYSSLTSSGDVLTVTAATARPDLAQPDRTLGDTVAATLEGDGRTTDLVADRGRLEGAEDKLYLDGNVVITTSDGMQMRTDALDVVLETGEAVSPSRVEGDAPFGHLVAGAMRLHGPSGAQMADFTSGVKLTYLPSRDGADGAKDETGSDSAATGAAAPDGLTGSADAPASAPQQGDGGQ